MRSSASVSVGVALLATAARGFLQGEETSADRYVSLILNQQVHMFPSDPRSQRRTRHSSSVECAACPTLQPAADKARPEL